MNQQILLNMKMPVSGFDDFMIGDNQQVIARIHRLIEQSATLDHGCSLFLWGERGVGKTHLLAAVSERMAQRQESCIYLDCEVLVTLPVDAVVGLESASIILVDNVDALEAHREWQEAMFHLYNRVVDQRHHLCFTATKSAPHLSLSLNDLMTRLCAAEIYKVSALTDAMKADFIGEVFERRGIPIGDAEIAFILHRGGRDPKSLRGIVERLDQQSLVEKRKITVPFIKKTLGW